MQSMLASMSMKMNHWITPMHENKRVLAYRLHGEPEHARGAQGLSYTAM